MDLILNLVQHPHVEKIVFLAFSGLVIRQSLVITGQRWANTYHHLGSFILLPCIALIITSIIKDDIALSLGMIGALSIVRFRTPVKSPFELVLFFALITLGIVCSVSFMLSFLLSIMVVLVIFGIKISDILLSKKGFNIFEYSFGDGNLTYTIDVNSKKKIEDFKNKDNLISIYSDNENNSFSYRFVFKSRKDLLEFEKKINNNPDILNIRADMQS